MSRGPPVVAYLVAALLAGGMGAVPSALRADEPEPPKRIQWVGDLDLAYAEARREGRPLLLAIHFRTSAPGTAWPEDTRAWNAIYADPAVVEQSRSFVCVQPALRHAPPSGRDAGPIHLILDAEGRRIAGVAEWTHAPGGPSIQALLDLLSQAGEAPSRPSFGAPLPPPPRPAASPGLATGPLARLAVPAHAEGIRIHLGFAGQVPELPSGVREIRARVLASWDSGDRRDMGTIALRAGETAADVPVDVRFEDVRASAEPPTPGAHRIDVWLAPAPSAFRFAETPLYAGVVYVDVNEGDGGSGGGGGGAPEPEPEPEPDDPEPPPLPDGPQTTPPAPPPEEERIEVIDPLVRHDRDRVRKEEAVVAVPDPEAGLEPPPLVPLAEAVRDFERIMERSTGDEKIRARYREFLRRYFRILSGGSAAEEDR